ncbi:BTAD domain-containing putative transcriptional regulator [Streptacidiphilus sp. P02-A3a]|uniref:AfsR/SARP family transcriptional regulator n=1 Tax=Streptacidiphilus sp. P02-A3a TaxID=2704468 RepID=UPI0015FB403F|nr:BTAD domain-containing putative transcriptional regulator [Streptacidiphilus sp. P02-A3a]QMU71714.1 tetratricopeptide repeat protein [Streptacidiphilus sp. P02-A3a]
MTDVSAAEAAQFRFQLLGTVAAWRDGTQLQVGSPQQVALLASLLLRPGQSVPLKQVVGDLWGGEVPDHAVGAVRTYASRLRAVLEPGRARRAPGAVLVSVGDGYTLRTPGDPALSVDVHAFTAKIAEAERLRAAGEARAAYDRLGTALALWQGEALLGVPGPYAEQQRGWLEQRRLAAAEARLELGLELGRHTEVLDALDTLVSEHPLREHLRELRMLALYRGGRQAEALACFAEIRELLVEELGIDPGPELSALHQRILGADPELAVPPQRPTTDTAAVYRAVVPAQLPTDIPDFAGREGQLEGVVAALRAPAGQAVAVITLFGIGGSGKTTLAVHAAHQVRDQFPDGHLFADLRGGQQVTTDPGLVLVDFLRSLGVAPGGIPDGLDERSAMFRSLLTGRRMLILIDNARDASQVRPLLPGTAGSAVLVTSRAQLAELPGTRLFEIEAFRRSEALDLFAAVIGAERAAAEPEAVEALVAACGFLPLGVRILASRLAVRPAWSAADLAERLADQERRLDELHLGSLGVEATFQLSYEQLHPEQARAFRLLALPDGHGLTTAAAAAAIGLPERRTEDVLESLHSAGLLLSRIPGRYQYHDLLRLFARRRSEHEDSAAQRAEVVLLLVDHLLANMVNATRALDPDGALVRHFQPTRAAGLRFADREQAARWPHSESALIFAITEQVVRNAADPDSVTGGGTELRSAVDLLLGLVWLLDGQVHAARFRDVLRPAGVAARRRGDRATEARVCYLSGLLDRLAAGHREAEPTLRRALELLAPRDAADQALRATVTNEIALVLNLTSRTAEALTYFEESLALCRDLGNTTGQARVLGNIARVHLNAGRLAEGVACAAQAADIAEESGSAAGVADSYYQLGIALRADGRTGEAVLRLRSALGYFQEQQRRSLEGLALGRLAECLADQALWSEAVALAEQSLVIAEELDSQYARALALAALGRALAEQGVRDRARECLLAAAGLFEGLRAPETAGTRELLARITASAD